MGVSPAATLSGVSCLSPGARRLSLAWLEHILLGQSTAARGKEARKKKTSPQLNTAARKDGGVGCATGELVGRVGNAPDFGQLALTREELWLCCDLRYSVL